MIDLLDIDGDILLVINHQQNILERFIVFPKLEC